MTTHDPSKISHAVKKHGADGVRQKALKEDAQRRQRIWESRERPERYIGPCIVEGCDKPANTGRFCGDPRHYCRDFRSRPGWWVRDWENGGEWVDIWPAMRRIAGGE